LRHVIVDEWSRGSSFLHRRDARSKLAALLLILLAIAVPRAAAFAALVAATGVLAALLVVSRLQFLARTAVVLPFAGVFAAITALTGHPDRALLLIARSWLSTVAILLVVATTPMPRVLHAMRSFGVPSLLVDVIQLVYRYLFLLAEQLWRMRTAAAARGGYRNWRAAAHTIASLFGRSYARAANLHGAMLARGFRGDIPVLAPRRFGFCDWLLLAAFAIPVFCLLTFEVVHGTTHPGP
jgi:cobalt/nickel transport system permease protein